MEEIFTDAPCLQIACANGTYTLTQRHSLSYFTTFRYIDSKLWSVDNSQTVHAQIDWRYFQSHTASQKLLAIPSKDDDDMRQDNIASQGNSIDNATADERWPILIDRLCYLSMCFYLLIVVISLILFFNHGWYWARSKGNENEALMSCVNFLRKHYNASGESHSRPWGSFF